MIIHQHGQGTPEWFAARCGIPTASEYGSILTPTGKPSTSAETYRNKLLAEWLLGARPESFESPWMARGKELEAEARDLAALVLGRELGTVGFCARDDGLTGCSPDWLTDDEGGEIKCVAPHTQIAHLLRGTVPSEYIPQVQGCMYITGRDRWIFVSYSPGLPPLIVTVARDPAWIKAFDERLSSFIADLLTQRERLSALR